MSTTFPLPPECLHMIIRHLADRSDRHSLAALLRVNKCVCSATLPIMYTDPFRLRPYSRFHKDAREILVSLMSLVQVLLRSLPSENVSELLRAAYLPGQPEHIDQDQDQDLDHRASTLTATLLPYSSFTTDIDFEKHGPYDLGLFHAQSLPGFSDFNDFLERNGLAGRYLAEYIPEGIFPVAHNNTIFLGAAHDLRRDLTWALCTNAERIHRLVIPISDITRYLAMVGRFKALSDVTFLFDRDLQYVQQELTAGQQEVLALKRSERARHLEEMVLFVQEHRRQHGNVLQVDRYARCPDEYQNRLAQDLPPLLNPHYIDRRNWPRFVAKPQETDLSSVKFFSTRNIIPQLLAFDRLLEQGPFLQRCRSLEKLDMISPGEDAFQWAADERKHYIAEIASGQTPRQRLVPLRSFCVDYTYSTGRQINDVGFAFQDTLEDICVRIYHTIEQSPSVPYEFLLGDNHSYWDLPRLNRLDVKTNNILLRVNSDFLQRCPQATHITLDDLRKEYSLDEVVHWKPAKLPSLTALRLCGTPALSFHPVTLKYSPDLEVLQLLITSEGNDGATFIPPAALFQGVEHREMNDIYNDDDDDDGDDDDGDGDSDETSASTPRRQGWTWNWELPKLTTLTLKGEFGYRFRFRMLYGAPSLVYLELDILSTSGDHEQTVGLQDLIKPGFQTPEMLSDYEKIGRRLCDDEQPGNNTDNTISNNTIGNDITSGLVTELDDERIWQEFDYIQLSALMQVSLLGSWRMDCRVLKTLFGKVMPRISTVAMSSCLGHDFADWMDATKMHLHYLSEAEMRMTITAEMIADAGLVNRSSLGEIYGIGYQFVDPPAGRTFPIPAVYRLYC